MSDWRQSGTVAYAQWRDTITAAGGPAELASRASYDAAGDLSALILAIAGRESRWGTTFDNVDPSQKNAFGLRPRGEPGYQTFSNWTDAVTELRARITDPTYAYADTTDLESFIHTYSPDSDNSPGQEAAYVATIRTLWLTWGVKETAGMAIVATECEIILDPLTGPGVNRPALSMPDASFVTVHEVGNTAPGADAKMHRDFVHNGGGANAVSFHFVVDEGVIYQLVYLNENAWHASDYYSGRGNRDSIAIETVQIGDFGKTLGNLAWLIAEIYRNPTRFLYRSDVGRTDDLDPALAKERTKRHYDWAPDKKWCPQFMLTRELWLPLLDAVALELADVAPQVPKYAAPILPEWWSEQAVIDLRNHREDGVLYKPLGTRITATKDTGAYAHPWLSEGKGKRTRAVIKKGETVDVRYRANHPTTNEPWGITRYGTWVAMKHFTPHFIIRNIDAE